MRTLYLSSKDSQHLFPSNRSGDFLIALPQPLRLQQLHTLTLTEVCLYKPSQSLNGPYIDIFCDICQDSVANATIQPILRRIYLSPSVDHSVLDLTHTYPSLVRVGGINQLRIYIRNYRGELVPDIAETLYCTVALHSLE